MQVKITFFSPFRVEKQHETIVSTSSPGKNKEKSSVSHMASRNVSGKEILKLLDKKHTCVSPVNPLWEY